MATVNETLEASGYDIGTNAGMAAKAAADIATAAFMLERVEQVLNRLPPVFVNHVAGAIGTSLFDDDMHKKLRRLADMIDLAVERL